MAIELAARTIYVAPPAAEFLKLLADPTRRQIFLLLMRGEICNCELAAELDLPQNLISHHIRKLREAGLVQEHRDAHDGRWIHYTVGMDALTTAWQALAAAFDPAHLGSRLPLCRSTTQEP
jgi:DNA-binding transcriptional ArsR family regulator